MSEVSGSELRARFLEGMSRVACTVSIITTQGPGGRFGVTVSAMASVSADGDAPVLLSCIHEKSPAAAAILANRSFCVNVLRADQFNVSDCFAGRLRGRFSDKFDCASWSAGGTGAPRMGNPLVAFDCVLLDGRIVGSHHVLLGSVSSVLLPEAGSPLTYVNRRYLSNDGMTREAEWALGDLC